jgi:hypothetical protein
MAVRAHIRRDASSQLLLWQRMYKESTPDKSRPQTTSGMKNGMIIESLLFSKNSPDPFGFPV